MHGKNARRRRNGDRFKNADLNTKLKAIDILNKMDGEYKTILDGKVEVKKKLEDVL